MTTALTLSRKCVQHANLKKEGLFLAYKVLFNNEAAPGLPVQETSFVYPKFLEKFPQNKLELIRKFAN